MLLTAFFIKTGIIVGLSDSVAGNFSVYISVSITRTADNTKHICIIIMVAAAVNIIFAIFLYHGHGDLLASHRVIIEHAYRRICNIGKTNIHSGCLIVILCQRCRRIHVSERAGGIICDIGTV